MKPPCCLPTPRTLVVGVLVLTQWGCHGSEGRLDVAIVLDRSGCVEDPHDYPFAVDVFVDETHEIVDGFDLSIDGRRSVYVPPDTYGVTAEADWSPDGPNDTGPSPGCSCYGGVRGAGEAVAVEVGDKVDVSVPIVCWTGGDD